MDANQTIELAKSGKLNRDQVYDHLMGFAKAQKRAGESDAQSFSRFVQKDRDGQLLFREMQNLPTGAEVAPSKPTAIVKVDDDGVAWRDLVKAYAKTYHLSEAKAVDQLLLVPEGQKLFKRQMRAERVASGQYSEMDFRYLDACDAQHDEHRELHKRVKVSLFEQMVSDLRAKHPHMTLSDAQDFVMATPEGKVAWAKFKENFDGPDPQDAPISGKPQPDRPPDWQQYAVSDLTPPRKFPVADDTVRFKRDAEAAIAKSNLEFFAGVLVKASHKAGRPWSAMQAVEILKQCSSLDEYWRAAAA
jgi:hypothetical protein